jgi:nitrite reductase/ring-hydroxylating ferredoxin subunit
MNNEYLHDGDLQFARVCAIAELPVGRSRKVYFDEERQIALFNVDGHLYAVSNICPHQHEPVIAEGMVEDCTVTCPLHGNSYRLDTGAGQDGGASLKKYAVRIVDDIIYVEVPPVKQPKWMQGL